MEVEGALHYMSNYKGTVDAKNLQKHMGGLVKTSLDLKIRLESLEKKDDENGKDDIESILERH